MCNLAPSGPVCCLSVGVLGVLDHVEKKVCMWRHLVLLPALLSCVPCSLLVSSDDDDDD